MDLSQHIDLNRLPRLAKHRNLQYCGANIEAETNQALVQLASQLDTDKSALVREILRAGVMALKAKVGTPPTR